jgi:hypothetical protein
MLMSADFLCCPGFALMLSLRNQQPLWAKELVSDRSHYLSAFRAFDQRPE